MARFNETKEEYAERKASRIVEASYWKVIAAALAAANLLLAGGVLFVVDAYRNLRPLVYRIDKLGRTEPVRYDDAAWSPQEPEMKYFITQFVRLYYGRRHLTIANDFAQAQAFVTDRLAKTLRESWAKAEIVRKTQAQTTDVEIDVTRVAFGPLKTPPYRASVDFDEVYYDDSRNETTRKHWGSELTFSFLSHVPLENLVVNPLGLNIVDFREDPAFK